MRHIHLLCLLSFSIQYVAYAQIPPCIPSGIVAWWPADGDATERINGNNGTLQGGATFDQGVIGQAFSFDGSTGRVVVPNSPLWAFGSRDFTIDLWANFSFIPNTDILNPAAVFVANDEGPANRNNWIFSLGGGFLNCHFRGTDIGPVIPVRAPFNPVLNQWYHLAITRSGSTFTLYINGIAAGSGMSSVVIPTPNAPLTIGETESVGWGQTFFMNGLIDEVEIYNRALPASEINRMLTMGSSGVKCVPALYTSAAPGIGSSGIVTRFDLTTLQATRIATVNGFASGLACGPDGKLYVALTGYGCCSPPRKIVRINLDGTEVSWVCKVELASLCKNPLLTPPSSRP